MKVGFNMLLWTTHVTEDDFAMLGTLKKVGFDGVEIPIFGGEAAHFKKIGKVLKDNGLGCTSVTVIPDEEHNPVSADAKNRKGAVEYLKWAIDCSAALGSDVLCGPFYQPLGVFTGAGPTEEEKKRAAEVHKKAADAAAAGKVALAVEFLNRFECYFLNTMADAAAYVKRVNHPNFGVLYDTFHANIEEQDPVGAIKKHIGVINHVHISENDRGTPGKGHIDWAGTFKAIRSGGYDKWLVIEAFGRALPDLAAATRVWRDFFPSRE
jgi:D-psicose/D-tagatose/L-ribulose 3-epimerase